MNTLKILRLELRNFKGQRNLNLDFGGRSCTIYGDNATGKTTVYDAFSWLLFGVDSLGQSAFDIKPLDSSGRVLDHGAVTSVEADLMVGTEHHTLKRTYYEKWSKKRGSVNETYDGNICDYFLDDVPVKKKLYDETVRNMVGSEQTFRILTDLRRFCAMMPWRERRKLLMDMCWDTSDQEVMEQDGRFHPLLEAMGGRSMDDFQAMLVAKRKNLSGTRDKIPTRLDELNRMTESIPVRDYDAVRKELSQLQEQLQAIQLAADKDGYAALLDQMEQKLTGLEEQRRILEQSNRAYQDQVQRPDAKKLEQDVKAALDDCSIIESNLKLSGREIGQMETELEKLRDQWVDCKALKFTGGICPTCGQALPPDHLEKAVEEFKVRQKQKLTDIEKHASQKKKWILTEKRRKASLEDQLQVRQTEVEQAKAALAEAKAQAEQPVSDMPYYTERRAELDRRIQECADSIADLRQENAKRERDGKAEQLRAEIRRQESLLADERTMQNAMRRRAELEAEQKKAAEALEELDHLLHLCDEFTRCKVKLIDDTVSSCFRQVRFKLFHEQVNGGLAECCEVTVNGVPYASLNNGAKINAGIDIVRTLSEYYSVKVPLFIDNAESVTEIMDAGTQVICLSVSEQDKELRLVS